MRGGGVSGLARIALSKILASIQKPLSFDLISCSYGKGDILASQDLT